MSRSCAEGEGRHHIPEQGAPEIGAVICSLRNIVPPKERRLSAPPEPRDRTRRHNHPGRLLRGPEATRKATSLNYYFRMEIDGVLVFSVVPKGPSINPADKRLAMMTEEIIPWNTRISRAPSQKGYGPGPRRFWRRARMCHWMRFLRGARREGDVSRQEDRVLAPRRPL
jgi:hypothetical protein